MQFLKCTHSLNICMCVVAFAVKKKERNKIKLLSGKTQMPFHYHYTIYLGCRNTDLSNTLLFFAEVLRHKFAHDINQEKIKLILIKL